MLAIGVGAPVHTLSFFCSHKLSVLVLENRASTLAIVLGFSIFFALGLSFLLWPDRFITYMATRVNPLYGNVESGSIIVRIIGIGFILMATMAFVRELLLR